MNLDIVLEWMKTFDGKVTPGAIQRKFGIGIWYAARIAELEAAIQRCCRNCWADKATDAAQCRGCGLKTALKGE